MRKPIESLKSVKQHNTESLRVYIKRFNEVALQVVNYNDQINLVKLEKPDSLVEMMETVQKFVLMEDGEDEEDRVKEKGGKNEFKKRKGNGPGTMTQAVPAPGNQVQQYSQSNFPKTYFYLGPTSLTSVILSSLS